MHTNIQVPPVAKTSQPVAFACLLQYNIANFITQNVVGNSKEDLYNSPV